MKKPPQVVEVFYTRQELGCYVFALFRKNALLFECTNRVSTQNHSDLLSVDYESLLLKVRLEYAICATQREANVVAKLLAFTGEFASCYHNIILSLL